MSKKLFNNGNTPEATPAAVDSDNRLQLKADKPTDGPSAIMLQEEMAVVAVGDLEALGFDTSDNMSDVEPNFPAIKIISQAQTFELPDQSLTKTFEGIILDTRRSNAYWIAKMGEGEGNKNPDCFSYDGIRPHGSAPISETCAKCPMNIYGSETGKNGEPGRGKACKNMRRLHVLIGENILPFKLSLPPTSLKSHDAFMMELTNKRLPYPCIVTKFSLVKATNKAGTDYSQIKMEIARTISDRQTLLDIKGMREAMAETFAHQEITADEYHIEADASSKTGDCF